MASSSPVQSPAKKRIRTDDTIALDSGEWKRHPELYMPDGTMVLLASNTLFRVYPGLLSKHSEVFRDMTSLSDCQPPNTEIYDGCPVVRLTDNAEDLAFFIATTMGLHQFYANQPVPFSCIAAVLRLSSKYMVAPLRRQALDHLSTIIPKKLNDIEKQESYKIVFGDDIPHPFQLVSLFHECQVMSFLPWAYYVACKRGFDELVNGAVHNGQTIQLTRAESRAALMGWKTLRDESLKTRHNTVVFRSPDCKLGPCNDSVRLTWLDTVFHGVRSNALEQWKFFESLACSGGSAQSPSLQSITPCSACAAGWLKFERERRDEIWDQLPKFFGLPPWDVLENEALLTSSRYL